MMPSIAYIREQEPPFWNLYWDNGNELLDLELYNNGTVSWFYKDRVKNKFEGNDEDPEPFYSNRLKELLDMVTKWK